MGLFDRGNRKAEEEERIKSSFRQNPLLDVFVQCLTYPEHGMLVVTRGYDDSRTRSIVVDRRHIYFCPRGYNNAEDAVKIDCTEFGYAPMTATTVLELSDVMFLWCQVLKEKVKELHPEFQYVGISPNPDKTEYYFSYKLPALEWKSWP